MKQNKCVTTDGEMGRITWVNVDGFNANNFNEPFKSMDYVGVMRDINVLVGVVRMGRVNFLINTHGAPKRIRLAGPSPGESIWCIECADQLARKLMSGFPAWWVKDAKSKVCEMRGLEK